jgi:hypothetical protein
LLLAFTFGYTFLRNISNIYSFYFRISSRESIILNEETKVAAYLFRTEFHPNVKSLEIEFYPGNKGEIIYEYLENQKLNLKWKNIVSGGNELKKEFENANLTVRIIVSDSNRVLKIRQNCENAKLYSLESFDGKGKTVILNKNYISIFCLNIYFKSI